MEIKLIIVYCILSVISAAAAEGIFDGLGGDSCSLVDVEFHSAGTPVKQ